MRSCLHRLWDGSYPNLVACAIGVEPENPVVARAPHNPTQTITPQMPQDAPMQHRLFASRIINLDDAAVLPCPTPSLPPLLGPDRRTDRPIKVNGLVLD